MLTVRYLSVAGASSSDATTKVVQRVSARYRSCDCVYRTTWQHMAANFLCTPRGNAWHCFRAPRRLEFDTSFGKLPYSLCSFHGMAHDRWLFFGMWSFKVSQYFFLRCSYRGVAQLSVRFFSPFTCSSYLFYFLRFVKVFVISRIFERL